MHIHVNSKVSVTVKVKNGSQSQFLPDVPVKIHPLHEKTAERSVITAADCLTETSTQMFSFPHPQHNRIHKYSHAVSKRDSRCPWSAATQSSPSRHDHCLSLVSYALNYSTVHMFGTV